MKALYLKEISGFLTSVIGLVFLGVFFIISGLFLWIISNSFGTNILETGFADLYAFFKWSPYFFLCLIPAITMRTLSEEKRSGTIELLLTKPITQWQIVFAKFLAGATLVLIALIPTLTYYVSIYQLAVPIGNVDTAATLGSYFGVFMIGSAFVSIGLFASSVTKSQIVSFILSLALCWFLYDGLGMIGTYSNFETFDLYIKNLGLMKHYENVQRGVIDLVDVVYFVSVTYIFLFASKLSISKN